jgi:hypothetical protein
MQIYTEFYRLCSKNKHSQTAVWGGTVGPSRKVIKGVNIIVWPLGHFLIIYKYEGSFVFSPQPVVVMDRNRSHSGTRFRRRPASNLEVLAQ